MTVNELPKAQECMTQQLVFTSMSALPTRYLHKVQGIHAKLVQPDTNKTAVSSSVIARILLHYDYTDCVCVLETKCLLHSLFLCAPLPHMGEKRQGTG
jgi:hypothetical protein